MGFKDDGFDQLQAMRTVYGVVFMAYAFGFGVQGSRFRSVLHDRAFETNPSVFWHLPPLSW